ncbi:hydrogenase maturation protease [Thiobacillus sp.]
MSRVRILGIGSPSGDDQAGWLTVDTLAACGVHPDRDVTIEKPDRPGAHLTTLLEDAGWVILVDAMQSGDQPGRIKRFDRNGWQAYAHGLSSHGLGVLEALALARELGTLPPRLDLYGIEIAATGPGHHQMSVEVHAAVHRLARHIAAAQAPAIPRWT